MVSLGDIRQRQGYVKVSFTAPSHPRTGDLWLDKINCFLNVWRNGNWETIGTCGGAVPVTNRLQQEDFAFLLQEDNSYILLQ